ncbi:hypothetical protein [Serpentinimonas maccroryi]|uniref:hypothetical protein n=1 Tax=Serpentinimonas maccroryi TaxID=1458426 RepID=UPI00203387AC|nr:hypothetical protein [Serpentinimonas maccroryi]MCM2478928.1 hypothetical protein [Serpentinimonas maccroryi]
MSSLKEQLSASVRSSRGKAETAATAASPAAAGAPKARPARRAAAPAAATVPASPRAARSSPPAPVAVSLAPNAAEVEASAATAPPTHIPASRPAGEPKPSARELFPSRVWPD